MKLRHIFLLVFVAFSAVFYTLLFTQNTLLFKYIESDKIFTFYNLAACMVLLYGLEGEKKAGGGFVELAFFFVALAVAVVGRVCFLSDAGKRFGIDIEVSQALAFSTLIMMILYELVYFISKTVFDHDFELASKADFFTRPVDWFFTVLIMLGGIAAGIIIEKFLLE